MKTTRTTKLTLASLLTILGMLGTYTGYADLSTRLNKQLLLVGFIHKDPVDYNITYQGQCLGTWKSELKPIENSDGHTYEGLGQLKIRLNKQLLDLGFSLTLGFTELDQLGASIFKLWRNNDAVNDASTAPLVVAGHTGVSPLNSVLHIKQSNAQPFSLKAALPGPFLLQEIKPNSYAIQAPAAQVALPVPPALAEFALRKVTESNPICSLTNDSVVDLSALGLSQQQQYLKIIRALPFAALP